MQRSRCRVSAMRVAFGIASAGLCAVPATALNAHFISAAVGQSTATITDSSFNTAVNVVQASYQNGVPGTDPNARALFASVDSASGVLLTSGVTVALQVPNRGRAVSQSE